MSHIQTSPETPPQMTQHAMLVIWGIFARRIGLVKAIEAVKLKQGAVSYASENFRSD